MKIVRPSPFRDLITSRTSAMPLGSKPEVGSSRIRSSGSWRMTWGGRDEFRHDFDRGGLSGAVRTQEAGRGSRRDGQIERLQGGEVTILLAEALQVDRNTVGHRFRAFLRLHENRDISRYT